MATLNGPSRAAVLSFSVGTQIAMAAWSVVLGFAAILLVFRTTDWRGLIRQAQDEADAGGSSALGRCGLRPACGERVAAVPAALRGVGAEADEGGVVVEGVRRGRP